MPSNSKNAAGSAEPLCQKLADDLNYELVEVSFDREPAGMYLRIYIDTEDGVTLDDCERYHRAVQPLLESFEYDFLEISSPGIDRPIKTRRDIQRAIGQQVEIRLYKPLNGQKLFHGVFLGFEDGVYSLESGGENLSFSQKEVALIKCVPDMDGIDDVELL